MEKLVLLKKDVLTAFGAVFLLLILVFTFGYFFGRYEQIQLNRSMLELIPDVNCGSQGDSL
ncbi:MAG TPA: hypothetical protein VI588_02370 [Candidatus Gracilibacteria bacterium]|nr:hypothetical protein [Candidatus Gracilibacteria bacterium]